MIRMIKGVLVRVQSNAVILYDGERKKLTNSNAKRLLHPNNPNQNVVFEKMRELREFCWRVGYAGVCRHRVERCEDFDRSARCMYGRMDSFLVFRYCYNTETFFSACFIMCPEDLLLVKTGEISAGNHDGRYKIESKRLSQHDVSIV